jgi:hypothetical protein
MAADMSEFEELKNKSREKRSPLEQCIVDAACLESIRDGDYTQMEVAARELKYLRSKRLEGISAYDVANAAVDELFSAGDGTTAHRIELKDYDDKGHGGWAKVPARNIILKHIRAALGLVLEKLL